MEGLVLEYSMEEEPSIREASGGPSGWMEDEPYITRINRSSSSFASATRISALKHE
jgi:hypothetical protein